MLDYTLVDYVFSNVGLFSSQEIMASATCTSSGNILKWSVNDWVFEDSFPTTAILQGTLLFVIIIFNTLHIEQVKYLNPTFHKFLNIFSLCGLAIFFMVACTKTQGILCVLLQLQHLTLGNPRCLRIQKAFFVIMKISPGWPKQNIFKKSKMPRKKT
jgi:hypothetical protein